MTEFAAPLVTPTEIQAGDFARRIVLVKHRLHELSLFQGAGLEEILESHPRSALSICGMADRNDKESWTEGELGDLSAAQLLETMERGMFWLNVRQIYQHQPAFRQLVDQLYDEIEQADPELRTNWRNATLLISSPSAFVNFHLDVPCNLLWHIRGTKRVWVYPRDNEAVVTSENLNATVAQDQTEMLPYDEGMDAHAEVFDLEPGQMISWPQNSPHRVDNLAGLNISLSTEHLTAAARRRIRVLQANHYLRRTLGVAPRGETTRGLGATAKIAGVSAFLGARKILGKRARGAAGFPVTFRLDPDAPGGRVELAK